MGKSYLKGARALKWAAEKIAPLLPNNEAASIRDGLKRLEERESNIVVLGQFKRGKSTLANCLVGKRALPTSAIPLTSIVSEMRFGKKEGAIVHYRNGTQENVKLGRIAEFATEKENPKNRKNVAKITVLCNCAFLGRGTALTDTPGLGSTFLHNSETTERYLPNCDAAIFVISADSPLAHEELEFIKRARAFAPKTFFVLNKADYVSARELAEIEKHVKAELGAAGIKTRLFSISAKKALEAIEGGDRKGLEKSGVKNFEEELARFLEEEKGKTLLESLRLKLRAATQALHNRLEAQCAGIALEAGELQQKSAEFREEAQAVLDSWDTVSYSIDGDFSQLLRGVEEDIEASKNQVAQKAKERVLLQLQSAAAGSNSGLLAIAKSRLQEALECELSGWWETEDAKIAKRAKAIEKKYNGMSRNSLERLAKIASGLFRFQPQLPSSRCSLDFETGFYYKIDGLYEGNFTPQLHMLLPCGAFKRKLLEDLPAKIEEEADRNFGRIRYDYAQRLEKGRDAFKDGLLGEIHGLKEEIETGIKSAAALSSATSAEKSKKAMELKRRLAIVRKIGREIG